MSKKQVTSGTKAKKTIVNIIIHIFLAILSFIWVLPIFWVVLTSFRGEKGSYVTTFFPKNRLYEKTEKRQITIGATD